MADEEDPIRVYLRDSLAGGAALSPEEMARAFQAGRAKPSDPPNAWRRYLQAFKQQAISLAKAGEVEFVRKGNVIPLDELKGLLKVRAVKSP